ncbi:fibronectin type III domain-containing protein [Paenibacillus sp. Soil522]|uniref:fibronectin type III domain-containing protein n=1 Tax=Paenibacillus sp. Soil522 TaxID=1736388 RepID=UPI0006F27241|nr:fibronectin type III domain-containing protein [Paenibacillus sp. Soil522]KRE24987.1 hypothetical protein ASG81_28015 [Paenibacillus sp. Soil522]
MRVMKIRNSWLWSLVISMLMALILPMYAHAQESITVTIKQLKTDQAATKLVITAAISSLYELKSVNASTEGREIQLTRSCPSCDWTGEMQLAGLAKGQHTVTVTAVDIYNSTGTGTGTFKYDEPPVVTRLEPAANHSVIRNNSLHVIAEAEDDLVQPSFLVKIGRADGRFEPHIVESDQGAGRFDRVYDVTQDNGRSLKILYYISDGTIQYGGEDNYRVNVWRTVHVESSPEIIEVQREPEAEILDADVTRLLLIRNGTLVLKNRSDGTETKLPLESVGSTRSEFQLTPAGAVMIVDTGWYQHRIFYWNGEKFSSVPFEVEISSPRQVRGNYVAFAFGGYLHWINTETGATRSIRYYQDYFELEPNGSVLLEPDDYSGQSDRILRYDPVTDSTTTVFEYPGAPRGPVSDGKAILFTLNDGSLMKVQDGTVSQVLKGTAGAERAEPHYGYEVNNGWIAFKKPDTNGVQQLYLQSPDGTVTQATYFNTGKGIHSLHESGTLVLGNNSKLYQYRQGMDKPSLIGGGAGVVRWIDGKLHYLLGDTIFEVKSETSSDTKAPEWPADDVLTVTDVTYNSVQLNWHPATDETGVDKYLVYHQDNTLLDTLNGDVNSYEVKGLSPSSSYLFSLVAVDAAGNQSVKKEVTVTTAAYTAPGSFQLSDSKTYSDGWYNYEYSLYYGYISSPGQVLSGSWSPPKGYHGVVNVSMGSPYGENYDLSLETVGEGNRLLTNGTEYSATEVPGGYKAEWRVKGHTDKDYSPDKKVFVYVYIRYDNH